ncbi:MAG: hypothetical protein ACLS9K_05570 [Lachnospira eligens]
MIQHVRHLSLVRLIWQLLTWHKLIRMEKNDENLPYGVVISGVLNAAIQDM